MPRFESYSEDDLQDIIDEICCAGPQGPYFFVGGTYIHPAQIISFQGPEESPTFTLEDGTTVTHDRFAQQENGDLLFRALKVLRRPIGKSQEVKPAVNLLIQRSGSDARLLDRSGSIIRTLSNHANDDSDFAWRPNVGYMEVELDSFFGARLYDSDGNKLAELQEYESTGNQAYHHVYITPGGDGFYFWGDIFGPTANVAKLDTNGTTNIIAQTGGNYFGGAEEIYGIAANENPGYFVFGHNAEKLSRLPTDGSSTSVSTFGNTSNVAGGVEIEDDGTAWYLRENEVKKIDATNINANPTTVYTGSGWNPGTFGGTLTDGIRYKEGNRVVVLEDSTLHVIDVSKGKEIYNSNNDGFSGIISAGLDLTRI